MIKNFHNQKGYTIVEALIYIAVFVVMSSITVALIFSILETNRQVSPLNSISRGVASSLEVITKEIRGATSVDSANSIFSTSTGSLQLNALDAVGNTRTVKFYLESGVIKIDEDGFYLGPLSAKETNVTGLIFNLSTSTKQDLVGIELQITAGNGKYQKNETFYSSVGLRIGN